VIERGGAASETDENILDEDSAELLATTEPVSPSEAALARHRESLRRPRLVYASVVSVVVVALLVVVTVAWSRGEVANTALHTVPKTQAPASLAIAAPTPSPQVAWRTGDRSAIGVPQWGGTVVVWSKHTVRGLDARTGRQTWSYARSNRTVCTAAQAGGTTVAIYQVNGNCDEVTAVDSQTGTRRWTRTLDMDGLPVYGQPTYQVLSFTVMVTTPSVIYAIDPVSGYNRWTFRMQGCTINRAVLGSTGALISQFCAKPECGKLTFCGRGAQVLLRDGIAGSDDKSDTNPDKLKWNSIGDTDLPVSADAVVSTLDPTTRTLNTLNPGSGKSAGAVALAPFPTATDPIVATAASGTEVIWLGGVVYAVRTGSPAPIWAAKAPSPPTVASTTGEDSPDLSTARVTLPTATGIRLLDGNDGHTAQSFPVTPPAPGSLVYSLGTGFLVAGPDGTVAYR
jgi:hypothetical protein